MKKILGILLVLVSSSAFAVNRHYLVPLDNATAPLKLVSAQGGTDHTDLVVTASATTGSSFNLDQCQQPAYHVNPDGSVNIKDFATLLCVKPDHFRLVDVPTDSLRWLSVVSIGNSTFEVPPIGAVDRYHTSTIGRYPQYALVNDGQQSVYVTTFNEGNLAINVHGPTGALIGTEYHVTSQGLGQFKLTTAFTSGWIDIHTEPTGFGPCSYCSDGGQVYGLVTVATPTNGLSRTYPF